MFALIAEQRWLSHRKVRNNMACMVFDEEGLLDEPCLSCDNAYIEDIWHEWCCDEKECLHRAERSEKE